MASGSSDDPIAIVGLGCLLPGARDPRELWENIVNRVDCISEVPASHWNPADYYDPDPSASDKTYCRRGGFIPEVEFDPIEFGLPPNTLEVIDSSQLLGLLVARQALEDAGYTEIEPALRARTGVILGLSGTLKLSTQFGARLQYPLWERVLERVGLPPAQRAAIVDAMQAAYPPWREDAFPGMVNNVVAGRIANRFDFGGINCIVDAACASSLAAVRMAVAELAEGRADLMIAGGVDTDNSALTYVCFSKTPAFSQQGSIRPFDAEADGTLVGEGLGMVVLKRLADAQRDRDRIYAVIRAVGTSSDGRHSSVYNPHSAGQQLALQRTYREANLASSSVDLIEAHGTGTAAGDQAELAMLRELFAGSSVESAGGVEPRVALGSIKSQIGHLKGAAGAAGLLKAVLALHHKVLPPTINVDRPRQELDRSPLYLNTETRPWPRALDGQPRRAGVSAFGFGGTNFHVVVEEQQAEQVGPYRLHRLPESLVLCAGNADRLVDCCEEASRALRGEQAEAEFARLVAESGRLLAPEDARLGLVAVGPTEAAGLLEVAAARVRAGRGEVWRDPAGAFYRPNGLDLAGKIVALFAGQGSQYVEMGRELACAYPEVRGAFAAFDRLLRASGRRPLLTDVFPPPTFDATRRAAQAATLQRGERAQPAIGALSVGQYTLLERAGFSPDFTAGHSFGELTALWAGGVVSTADYFTLVAARAEAMAPLSVPGVDAGTMLAVVGEVSGVEACLRRMQGFADSGLLIANVNSQRQAVVGGPSAAVDRAEAALAAAGYDVARLPVAAAFHTPLVESARAPFAAALQTARLRSPRVPVYANATGLPYPAEPDAIRAQWAEQMVRPVLFRDQIEAIYAAGGRCFVEFGPRSVLTNLVDEILGPREHLAVAVNPSRRGDSVRQLAEAVTQLRVAGMALGAVDRFAQVRPPARLRRPSAATIRLNGSNYVSEQTRAGFEKAMAHLPRLDDRPESTGRLPELVAPQPTAGPLAPDSPAAVAGGLESLIAGLAEQQGATARLHQQYLEQQSEYARLAADLVRQQGQLAVEPVAPSGWESLDRSLQRLHEHQADTSRVHETFLRQEGVLMRGLLGLDGSPHAPAPPPPAGQTSLPIPVRGTDAGTTPVDSEPAPAADNLVARLLAVVGDNTGYPPEMLDLDLDLEADLGVDSIKRVEIFSAMRTEFAQLPRLAPEEVGELRTLGQVAARFIELVNGNPPDSAVVEPAPAPTQNGRAHTFERALFDVVSEKTGYPPEMLETDQDLEADLGVDSIKRVEILSALRSRFPDLPRLVAEELAELRTLGQIVARFESTGVRAPPLVANGTVVDQPSPTRPAVLGVGLRPLPPPDALDWEPATSQVLLVTDDGTPTTAALAAALGRRGWPVVALRFMTTFVPRSALSGTPCLDLEGSDEAALENLLATAGRRFGQVAGFIHLHPTASIDGALFPSGDRVLVKQVFLLAKLLAEPLQRAASAGRAAFLTVTRLDGAAGQTAELDFSPISGGLAGLTKSLRQEWPGVFCRAVDLSPTIGPERAAELILAELFDPDRLVGEVTYGALGRCTPAAGPDLATRPA
jgi:acyl transferase domain-containing protein/acyl carrier protein